MAYHFGRERRRGSDRRAARNPAYAGVERRLAGRRAPSREREGPFSFVVIALILFVLVDTFIWHGYYRHAVYRGIDSQAQSIREWSDNIWDFRSSR